VYSGRSASARALVLILPIPDTASHSISDVDIAMSVRAGVVRGHHLSANDNNPKKFVVFFFATAKNLNAT
jgi:hypothetical protein